MLSWVSNVGFLILKLLVSYFFFSLVRSLFMCGLGEMFFVSIFVFESGKIGFI